MSTTCAWCVDQTPSAQVVSLVILKDKCANRHRISSNDTDSPQIQPTTRTHQSDSAQSRNHHFSELLHEIVTFQVPQPVIMTIHTHPARNQYFLKLLLEFTITLTLFSPDPCKFRNLFEICISSVHMSQDPHNFSVLLQDPYNFSALSQNSHNLGTPYSNRYNRGFPYSESI